MKNHKWTSIAPEACNELGYPEEIWKWCIKCGALKLGKEIFLPGPRQDSTIKSCNEEHAKECKW